MEASTVQEHLSDRERARLEACARDLGPARDRVLEVVRREPGVVIDRVAKRLGCSHENASYHLSTLCRMGLLVREKHGRGVRHYCVLDDVQRSRLEAYLGDARKRSVLTCLASQPEKEWVVNELANHLGVYHAFLLRLLLRLADHGFVRLVRPHGRYYVRPTTELVTLMDDLRGPA